jgi:hypothetical protein
MQLKSLGWRRRLTLHCFDASGLDAVASAQLTGVQRAANEIGRAGARANTSSAESDMPRNGGGKRSPVGFVPRQARLTRKHCRPCLKLERRTRTVVICETGF